MDRWRGPHQRAAGPEPTRLIVPDDPEVKKWLDYGRYRAVAASRTKLSLTTVARRLVNWLASAVGQSHEPARPCIVG
jgi:hypothetical protein